MKIKEDQWFRPYEQFSINDVKEKIEFSTILENSLRIKIPEYFVKTILSMHKTDGFQIVLDRACVDVNDQNKYDGERIYYPIRSPSCEELIVLDESVTAINGFGELNCIKDLEENDLIKICEKELYPYGLFVRTPTGIFYSICKVDKETEGFCPGAAFYYWKPYNNTGNIGKIYLPIDMKSLKKLVFRFSRLEEKLVYEDSSLFE